MSQSKFSAPIVFIAVLALVVPALFVYCWDLYFTSDYALIGLMGRRILLEGEQAIFVWSFGYMGVLLEANLIALMFSLFGMNEYSINFGPYLMFLILVPTFYLTVKAWSGARAAKLSTLFLILSCPYFYGKVLRTQPNYVEIYFFGLLLILLYGKLLFKKAKPIPTILIFGLLLGFSVYTYQQIYYFVGAILLHLACLYLHFLTVKKKRGLFELAFFPMKNHPLKVINFIIVALLFLGSVSWILGVERLSFFGVLLKYESLAIVKTTVALLLLFHGLGHFSFFVKNIKLFAGLILSFLIGFSPKIFFLLHLKEKQAAEVAFAGLQPHFSVVLRNVGYAWAGLLEFLNLNGLPTVIKFGMGVFYLGVFSLVFLFFGKKLLFSFRKKNDQGGTGLKKLSPLFFLSFSVFFSFILSKTVQIEAQFRYFLAIQLFISFGLGCFFVTIMREFSGGLCRRTGAVLAVGLLVFNGLAISKKLSTSSQGTFWKELIRVLDQNDITHGYANYWFAYVIDYLTDERILLEPVFSDYSPHYIERVQSQKRVAYIATIPSFIPSKNGLFTIKGRQYETEKKILMSGKKASFHQDPNVDRSVKESGYHIFILREISGG